MKSIQIILKLCFLLAVVTSFVVVEVKAAYWPYEEDYCDAGNTGVEGDCYPRVPTCMGSSESMNCRPQNSFSSTPSISSLSPADGSTSASVTAALIITMDYGGAFKGTGNFYIYKKTGDVLIETISVNASNIVFGGYTGAGDDPHTTAMTKVTIYPTNTFVGSTDYYIQIDSGAIENVLGNSFSGISNETTWNFRTGADTTAPTKTSTSPSDNATGVSVSSNLSITFSESIQKGTGDITIKKISDDSTVQTIAVTNAAVTISAKTATINPPSDLASDTAYYINIASGAFKDLSNNNYAGITNNSTWNFTTTDTIAPLLVSTVPPDNGAGSSVSANLTATFDENITKGSGTLVLKKTSDDSTIESFSLPSSTKVTTSGATVTINPTSSLIADTSYYITMTSGAIEDTAGNAYAGISDSTTWNFFSTDSIDPTVVSFTPADNAVGASNVDDLVIVFSENVQSDIAIFGFRIYKTVGSVLVETIYSNDSQITYSGDTVTINPTNDLLHDTAYYIRIDVDAIEDLSPAANNYAGISDNTTWNFTVNGSSAATGHFWWGGH